MGTYECFVGALHANNRIFIKEAGEHCQRNINPNRYGMELRKTKFCNETNDSSLIKLHDSDIVSEVPTLLQISSDESITNEISSERNTEYTMINNVDNREKSNITKNESEIPLNKDEQERKKPYSGNNSTTNQVNQTTLNSSHVYGTDENSGSPLKLSHIIIFPFICLLLLNNY